MQYIIDNCLKNDTYINKKKEKRMHIYYAATLYHFISCKYR